MKYGNANAWKYCCRVFDLLTVAAVSIIIATILIILIIIIINIKPSIMGDTLIW